MLRPVDIATKHSLDFIQTYAREKSDVLEIGCGEGDVAQMLQSSGYRVTAIDGDNHAVATARAKGVNAARARWPDYQSGKTDVVLFTRSLHHIHDLDGAVTAAQMRLHDDGFLLIEDFAFNEADDRTSNWFAAQLRSDPLANLLMEMPGSFAKKVLCASEPHAAWHSDHDHDLHSIQAMEAAVTARFDVKAIHRVPYLYRYLIPVLPQTKEAAGVIETFFRKEEQMIASGSIVPIGRRIAASLKHGD